MTTGAVLDRGPVPLALIAATVNPTVAPLVKPSKVWEKAVDGNVWAGSGDEPYVRRHDIAGDR